MFALKVFEVLMAGGAAVDVETKIGYRVWTKIACP